MIKLKKALLVAGIIGAVALPLSSANAWWGGPWGGGRSEEHTSELQSH